MRAARFGDLRATASQVGVVVLGILVPLRPGEAANGCRELADFDRLQTWGEFRDPGRFGWVFAEIARDRTALPLPNNAAPIA
jgi:hypothetical protein